MAEDYSKMNTRDDTIPTVDPRVDFFDRLADGWDASAHQCDDLLKRLERRAGLLELRSGECVLEIGCGTGQLTGWLAERVQPGRVVAIDLSPEMLRVAQTKGIPATFRLADVCQDDLGDAEFDLAFCFHSFPHFRDQPAALRNLARCLKSGGRLIVMHLDGRDEVNTFHHGVGGSVAHDFLPDDCCWTAWLTAAGFRQPQISDTQDGFFLRAVVDLQ
jgi:ubiquinone/menaquinone biosynthesis C-methylase UbiE